ncbi:hypothetical protein H6P81_009459 [Aristolochia fimbriata]|uniref:Uncharacterized protein n=1 Tax=Aristolochia fimbriata TaxID=158543 RepID=A0AAV7ELH5_ARIFI|nr:hypothetical protein H6P81_009459 [Aristolochia fimbriata]
MAGRPKVTENRNLTRPSPLLDPKCRFYARTPENATALESTATEIETCRRDSGARDEMRCRIKSLRSSVRAAQQSPSGKPEASAPVVVEKQNN